MSRIPLPPTPGTPDYRSVRAEIRDDRKISLPALALACGLIFVLAVLLVSYPVRHSDLWYRLAAGRDLLQGTWDLSVYPPNLRLPWLFNVGTYAAYHLGGGTVLVGVKALLIGCVGCLMLQLARSRGGLWLPTLAVAGCLVALAQRVSFQPIFVSCFFMALTYRWLDGDDEIVRPPRFRSAGFIVLFFAWAQIDTRVFVGWLAVLLASVGQFIDQQRRRAADRATARVLQAGAIQTSWISRLSLLTALAVVCLLNPLTWQMLSVGDIRPIFEVRDDGRGATSPFQSAFFQGAGGYPSGWFYHLLLLVGLWLILSGALRDDRAWRNWLPWFGLAFLSAIDVTFIPWFAVWSGPVLGRFAMREARQRFPDWERWNFRPLQGVACCWMAGLILCSWPGWLQGPPFEPRRWSLDLPESAERTADVLADWHASGRFDAAARGVHLSSDTAAAVRWFCPKLLAVADRTFAERIADPATSYDQLDEHMRRLGGDYLVVADHDRPRLLRVLERLLADPRRSTVLDVVGDTVICGWRDPASSNPPRWSGPKWDMEQAAFGHADPVPPPASASPPSWLERWRRWFTVPAVTRTTERDSAVMYLLLAEVLRQQSPVWHLTAWETSELAALIGSAAGWSGNLGPVATTDCLIRLQLFEPPLPEGDNRPLSPFARQVLAWQQAFTQQRDDTPTALLYLAIRAARRASAINPEDSRSYLVLGESYLRLMHSTRERAWRQKFPELGDLRRAQASAALNRAVRLEPSLAQAHLHLGALYTEMGYLDVALEHRRTYLTLIRRSPPPLGVDWTVYRSTLEQAARELAQLEEKIATSRDEWLKESSGKRVGDRAELAARRGLAGEALRTLLESDVSAFGTQGLRLELRLLLGMGRAQEVIDAMEPDQQAVLGTPTYYWTRTQAWAALGDYESALEEALRLAHPAGGDESSAEAERAIISLLVSRAVAEGLPLGKSAPTALIAAQQQVDLLDRAVAVVTRSRQRADAYVLRGLLALEAGQLETAQAAVGKALAWSGSPSQDDDSSQIDFRARPVARTVWSWLTLHRSTPPRTTLRSTP